MKHYLKLYVVLIFGASVSSAISEPMTAASAIALLSPADHLSNPPGFMDPKASAQESKLEQLYAQQLFALKYIEDNKVTDAIPDLILYLNYSICPGLGTTIHGEDNLSNVKNNWLAFGALVEMPQSVKVLKNYCLDDKNPIGYRIATLHALKYLDKDSFDGCWNVLKSTQSNSKVLLYLDYLKNKRTQYVGIHDFN